MGGRQGVAGMRGEGGDERRMRVYQEAGYERGKRGRLQCEAGYERSRV